MMIRFLLALLLLVSFTVVAVPTPAAAYDVCGACPAGGGGGADDCGDDCPLCACGPHRAPMTEPPAIPVPLLSPATEFVAHGDHAALASAPHDILHVPKFAASSQPF